MTRRSMFALLAGVVLGLSAVPGLAASLNAASQNLTAYRTCTLTATPSSTSVVADAHVRQAKPNTNYGTSTTLNVRSNTVGNERAYLKFDLTACQPVIAYGAIVRLATLRLFVSKLPTHCRTYDIFSATSSWSEGTITWNNQPFGTALNNPPAGSGSTSFTLGAHGSCQFQNEPASLTATLSSDVQSFVSGSTTNLGWMMRDDAEDSTGSEIGTFTAKDAGVIAEAPQLTVTYVVVP